MHTVVAPVSLLKFSKLRRRSAAINANATATATGELCTNVATPRAQKLSGDSAARSSCRLSKPKVKT